MPKVDNFKTETLALEQIKAVMQAIDEEQDQDAAALVRLALITGMRKGALLALKWADLDFDKGFIVLRGEAAKKGKTEKSLCHLMPASCWNLSIVIMEVSLFLLVVAAGSVRLYPYYICQKSHTK